ncbi:MAG: hypothetical protein EOP83_15235 [Verrucomicrobiaceae bacterium]|nr:MAG: hypothetical protein EOP83_15235 [Verrucomicrobiaceae bacterium]
MKTSHSIAVVLAGAVAGFLVSRSGDVAAAQGPEATVTHRAKVRPVTTREKAPPPRTLAGLSESIRRSGGLPEGVVEDLERLPSETLRERLVALAAISVPGSVYLTPSQKWYAGLDALAGELFHREGEASLIWAESTGDPDLTAALLRAAADDPALVKKWMSKLSPAWDPDRLEYWRVYSRVADIATSRGSEALLEAEALFPQSMPETALKYPEDFDFAGYVAKTQWDKGRSLAVKAWASRDPDAVAALLKSGSVNIRDGIASSAMDGVAIAADDASVVKWLGEWTSALGKDTREDVLGNLLRQETRQGLGVALVAGLSTPEDRIAVAASGLRHNWSGDSVAPYLEALPNAAERQGAVAQWWNNVPTGMRAGQRTMMEKTFDQMNLPPAEEEQLRARMTE